MVDRERKNFDESFDGDDFDGGDSGGRRESRGGQGGPKRGPARRRFPPP